MEQRSIRACTRPLSSRLAVAAAACRVTGGRSEGAGQASMQLQRRWRRAACLCTLRVRQHRCRRGCSPAPMTPLSSQPARPPDHQPTSQPASQPAHLLLGADHCALPQRLGAPIQPLEACAVLLELRGQVDGCVIRELQGAAAWPERRQGKRAWVLGESISVSRWQLPVTTCESGSLGQVGAGERVLLAGLNCGVGYGWWVLAGGWVLGAGCWRGGWVSGREGGGR